MSFEILDRFFVFLGRSFRLEGAEIPSLAGFGIFLPRIQSVLAGLKFSDHEVNTLYPSARNLASRLSDFKIISGHVGLRTFRDARAFTA